jgi:endo-1,4-beta-xylanase
MPLAGGPRANSGRSASRLAVASVALVAAVGCASGPPSTAASPVTRTLKDAFAGSFLVGAALNESQFTEQDQRGTPIVKAQFNTVTPENILKWENVHPRPGEYAFDAPDRYVAFGERNGMFVVGHTLVWHQQTPRWVFFDATGTRVSRDTLLARLRDHIHTVVGRYKGRIKGWDVVNEAVDEDGTLRKSLWLEIIGPDYLAKAFQFAHEADPQAELYYNDYSVENAPKRNGVVALIRSLQAEGAHVTGVGLQGHNNLTWPTVSQQDSTISAFAALGVKVMITELDIDVLPRATRAQTADVSLSAAPSAGLNPDAGGLPDSVQQALAKRYADLFGVYMKHKDAITRVTFWGVTDGDSWLNGWPVRGRTSYPLLFDRAGHPKPAFGAVIRTAEKTTFVP